MSVYKKPTNRFHRGFFYLDDEIVINSLSALEAGKIDAVVERINSAREGGLSGSLGAAGAKVEGGRKTNSSLEEELVRTRTRFSVFELWYQSLVTGQALGKFDGWGERALVDVRPGDTIEFTGQLQIAPIETLLRTFLWFAEKAKEQGHMFSQQKEELKSTKDAEKVVRLLLGDRSEDEDQLTLLAVPEGAQGPGVAMPVKSKWLIGNPGRLGGEYSIVAQVDRLLNEGESVPTLRLTHDVAATQIEIETIKAAISEFEEPAKGLGIHVGEGDAEVVGPALWLEPIAIYR